MAPASRQLARERKMSETFDPGEFLTPDEAAQYLTEELRWKTTKATLAKLRCKCGGPPYRRFRTRIRYQKPRLKEYVMGLVSDELHSTSES
jgi:hypothetical protein